MQYFAPSKFCEPDGGTAPLNAPAQCAHFESSTIRWHDTLGSESAPPGQMFEQWCVTYSSASPPNVWPNSCMTMAAFRPVTDVLPGATPIRTNVLATSAQLSILDGTATLIRFLCLLSSPPSQDGPVVMRNAVSPAVEPIDPSTEQTSARHQLM